MRSKLPHEALCLILTTIVMTLAGCNAWRPPNAGYGDALDAFFGRRHPEPRKIVGDDMLEFARELTRIEDDLRRDGTITVKTPDVWGDGNLVQSIQENDKQLLSALEEFDETLQAYIAHSDLGELQSVTSLSGALDGATAPTVEAPTSSIASDFSQLIGARQDAPAASSEKLSIEPTEKVRQHAAYLQVVQALRRRNMGDDNSRAAGYGLFLFRVPVSVLPGRSTDHGYSAVVNMRAQVRVNDAHLRYTLPRLAIADLVDALAPWMMANWKQPTVDAQLESIENQLQEISPAESTKFAAEIEDLRGQIEQGDIEEVDIAVATLNGKLRGQRKPTNRTSNAEENTDDGILSKGIVTYPMRTRSSLESPVAEIAPPLIPIATRPLPNSQRQNSTPISGISTGLYPNYGQTAVFRVLDYAREHFHDVSARQNQPKIDDLRAFLFEFFTQVHSALDKRGAYTHSADDGIPFATLAAEAAEKGQSDRDFRLDWRLAFGAEPSNHLEFIGWPLVKQMGLLDLNLKRILEELQLSGKIAPGTWEQAEGIFFFDRNMSAETNPLWRTIITESFPLHVFTLDPQVEEQNIYDAFARRRDLQLALAFGVATGKFNLEQRLRLSRTLALDQADIALNRTAVGFGHGEDTFGWYFHPRVQAPPVESSNLAALGRMIWSTGPTGRYDLRHRKLEPGIRECEVLIAMPTFVNEVTFDVTTNWEKVATPGETKRSYEEMVAQGGRIHRLKMCLRNIKNSECFRPGELERLLSRVDQLERMLSLQTHVVNIPFRQDQSGVDLFDRGDRFLRPEIHGYYGLEFVKEGIEATHFFITGKNFHPTQTHVIVGGFEAHSVDGEADVEVISRRLLKVKIGKLEAAHSLEEGFEVRVGTPSGMSNTFFISPTREAPKEAPKAEPSAFDWISGIEMSGDYEGPGAGTPPTLMQPAPDYFMVAAKSSPFRNPNLVGAKLAVVLQVTLADGTTRDLGATELVDVAQATDQVLGPVLQIRGMELQTAIANAIGLGLLVTDSGIIQVKGTCYLTLDAWPPIELGTPIVVSLREK